MLDKPWEIEYERYNLQPITQIPQVYNSLVDFIESKLSENSMFTGYVFNEASYSYKQVDTYSKSMAVYFQSLDLPSKSRIAVMLPNSIQYVVSALATVRSGNILVNTNPLYTFRELSHQISDSGTSVLITTHDVYNKFLDFGVCKTLKAIILVDINNVDLIKEEDDRKCYINNEIELQYFENIIQSCSSEDYVTPQVKLEDTALLQYTGGTTGISKGAELTHKNILSNIYQNAATYECYFGKEKRNMVSEEYILCIIPLYHIFAFTICLFAWGLNKGYINVLIPNAKDIDKVLDHYKKYPPTMFPGVNTLYNTLINSSLFKQLDHSKLKLSTGGGSAILAPTEKAWFEITNNHIYEGYGLSETSPTLTTNLALTKKFSGTAGIPLPSTDIQILDDEMNELGIDQIGEVAVKGPQVMKGYWNNLEETSKAFTKNGYFLTGDIGKIDSSGYLTILDRKKDMILVSGFNVYPNEIEQVLSAHPKISESAVIGIEDVKSGQIAKAFIVKKDNNLTEEDVFSYLRENLTGYKCPKQIEFLNSLPKSSVGKILRKDLKDLK